ncbi:MAG: hypothetical protein AAF346_00100 [Pseudomonadota bacterium]
MRVGDGTTDGTMNALRLEIFRLRQRLIGGVEGVKSGSDLSCWADANDRYLERTAYEADEFKELSDLDEDTCGDVFNTER